jgi:O-antigen ligase
MRGFYNEGGPYGLYLITVFLVGIVLSRQNWSRRSRIRLAYVPLAIALLGSQSKAAIFAAGIMMFFDALMVKQLGRRLLVVGALLGVGFLASDVPAITEPIAIYITTPAKYEYLSNLDSEEDLLSGRIAGAFIVQRMIQVHPWVGIGWGNYPLVRNSPEYRGGARWADIEDDPGLGILGTTADFGIPLTLFLVCITFYPYFYLRRQGAPLVVKNLALIQPVVHLCGAQLNLTYPWLITAFALGLGYYNSRHQLEAYAPQPASASPANPGAQSFPAPSA